MSYADTILKLKTRGGKRRAFSAYKIVDVAETDNGTEVYYSVGDPKIGPIRSVVVQDTFETVFDAWIDGLRRFEAGE